MSPLHAVSADARVYASKGDPHSRISDNASMASRARPARAQTDMCADHTAALGVFFGVAVAKHATSAPVVSPARRTASSAGHSFAATPLANTVSNDDAAWLFPCHFVVSSRVNRSYVSIAHCMFAELGSLVAAAANAAPKVTSVGSKIWSSSSSWSAVFAAEKSRARAAAVMMELYVLVLGAQIFEFL